MMNMTIMERIDGIAFEGLTEDDFNFLVERARKSVRKGGTRKGLTKTQKENEELKTKIYEMLAEVNGMTATQVGAEFGWNGSQKASALLKQMVEAGTVTRNKDGKVTIFTAVTE